MSLCDSYERHIHVVTWLMFLCFNATHMTVSLRDSYYTCMSLCDSYIYFFMWLIWLCLHVTHKTHKFFWCDSHTNTWMSSSDPYVCVFMWLVRQTRECLYVTHMCRLNQACIRADKCRLGMDKIDTYLWLSLSLALARTRALDLSLALAFSRSSVHSPPPSSFLSLFLSFFLSFFISLMYSFDRSLFFSLSLSLLLLLPLYLLSLSSSLALTQKLSAVRALSLSLSVFYSRTCVVKCRLGTDKIDGYDNLKKFVGTVSTGGACKHFILHSRECVLAGYLSPLCFFVQRAYNTPKETCELSNETYHMS